MKHHFRTIKPHQSVDVHVNITYLDPQRNHGAKRRRTKVSAWDRQIVGFPLLAVQYGGGDEFQLGRVELFEGKMAVVDGAQEASVVGTVSVDDRQVRYERADLWVLAHLQYRYNACLFAKWARWVFVMPGESSSCRFQVMCSTLT